MDRIPVSSSNLVSISYDEFERILEIEFKRSNVYQYFEVPDLIYRELVNASSKGKYHDRYIKGRFRYKKVR